jgi:hypothetical protein
MLSRNIPCHRVTTCKYDNSLILIQPFAEALEREGQWIRDFAKSSLKPLSKSDASTGREREDRDPSPVPRHS